LARSRKRGVHINFSLAKQREPAKRAEEELRAIRRCHRCPLIGVRGPNPEILFILRENYHGVRPNTDLSGAGQSIPVFRVGLDVRRRMIGKLGAEFI